MSSEASGAPKFRQIAEQIRARILSGELRPGDEIPSERAVAAEYDVSRPTATKSLMLLRELGLVHSVQGSGTFVSDLAVNRRASERYTKARTSGRIYADGTRAEIVAAEVVPEAPEHVVRALQLDAGSAAIRRHRITWEGDRRAETSTSWFNAELAGTAPQLLVRERIFSGTLTYVETQTGRRGTYARDRTCARAAGVDAEPLGLGDESAPVLVVEHTVYDQSDRPIEFAVAVYPADRWTYEQRYDLS
ncbi:GntR family transcriptional regulator [Nocardioides albertanoniae]|uniref:GntR family transcriptional regulator n=1 Tax=Nocardioides albertanoniae TaxID=1175486 RepID=A0A543ABV9_9ACTN|nr:GntR family transcriptional regulator [Nocardioides albertanoniae]TQL70078.1 GntR family transcriptional regulator [Nocardioides albertanoniae]